MTSTVQDWMKNLMPSMLTLLFNNDDVINNNNIINAVATSATTTSSFALCVEPKSCTDLQLFSLIMQCIMIGLFTFLLIFVIFCLARIMYKGTTFKTKTLFYVLMLFFCLGRVIFFSFKLFEMEVHPKRDEILHIICEFCFNWSSAFFYSAFSVLTIHFSENLFFASGFSVSVAKSKTKRVKLSAILFNVHIHVCQIALFIVTAIFMVRDSNKSKGPGANKLGSSIAYVVQYCFDGSISWIIVLFFSVWIAICTRSLWTDVLAENEERTRYVGRLRISAAIFCVLLVLKGIANFCLAIYQADCAWLCPAIQIIVYGFSAIAFDFLPLFIVVVVFSSYIRKDRDSVSHSWQLMARNDDESTPQLATNHSEASSLLVSPQTPCKEDD